MNKITLGFALFLLSVNARAMTAAELQEACRETQVRPLRDPFHSGLCLGFINGFAGASLVHSALTDIKFYCPSGVTNEKTVRLVEQYLQLHPNDRQEDAGLVLHYAMIEAFPCK